MKITKIKQLRNSAWVIRFTDDDNKSYVRFVSDSIVKNWEISEAPISISDLKRKATERFEGARLRYWGKNGNRRIYINIHGHQDMHYDLEKKVSGASSVVLQRIMHEWCKNGVAA